MGMSSRVIEAMPAESGVICTVNGAGGLVEMLVVASAVGECAPSEKGRGGAGSSEGGGGTSSVTPVKEVGRAGSSSAEWYTAGMAASSSALGGGGKGALI